MAKTNDNKTAAPKKQLTVEDPVKQVRFWLTNNRQSLKTSVEIERNLQAFEKNNITLPYMKEQVNRLLNRKFFAE